MSEPTFEEAWRNAQDTLKRLGIEMLNIHGLSRAWQGERKVQVGPHTWISTTTGETTHNINRLMILQEYPALPQIENEYGTP